MKKTGLLIVAAAFTFAACGGRAAAMKEYGEAFDVATKKVTEVSAELKDAKDGKAVAAAITKFADAINEMKVKGDALDKKHNLKMKGDEIPAELKPKFDAFMAASKALGEAMPDALKNYAGDADVAAALKKMQEVSKD